ncbi:MAG: YggU family protein [Gammaproteobacteria bacterium HGW-Gammaproteobacteria-1]|jgi:hypothetical protein|nr:MAG: YggU family protein [Gammaproteobacteria bacterium HGW-Gammaproteobacteria-1]
MAAWFRWQGSDLLLTVRLQPRASRDEIVGPHGDSLKIRITAPPVEGQANAHLIRFLAGAFGVSRSQVTLVSGETARSKQLRIESPRQLPPKAMIQPAI